MFQTTNQIFKFRSSLWDWYTPHIQPYRRLTFDPTPIQTAQAHIRPYPNENKQPLQQKTTCIIRSHSTIPQLLSGVANFQPRWGGVGVLDGMLTFSHTCKPNTTHLRAAGMLTFPSTSKPRMAHFQAHRGVVGLGWGGMLTFNVKHLQTKDGTPPGGSGYVVKSDSAGELSAKKPNQTSQDLAWLTSKQLTYLRLSPFSSQISYTSDCQNPGTSVPWWSK